MISRAVVALALAAAGWAQAAEPLIVVDDVGGASALPYYRALNLQSLPPGPAADLTIPVPPSRRFSEADMLPVRPVTMKPGTLARRVVQLAALHALFVIGDDRRSRAWLRTRLPDLVALGAIGVVTQVESKEALDQLRRLAPGLTLVPAPADDLGQRLQISTYPVLITPTGIEQ